jgi:type VI secretion system lysozyme-like protein
VVFRKTHICIYLRHMARGGVTDGARAPLFDRLAGREQVPYGDPPRPLRILDRAALAESLQRELQRMLNVRRPEFKSGALSGTQPTVIEYGLPDYSAMYTANPEDQKKLSNLIRSAIESFEPRLRQVKVEVRIVGNSEKSLQVKVAGSVVTGRETERMSFAVSVAGGSPEEAALGR